MRHQILMAELPDSPYVLVRWQRAVSETEQLLQRHEELMQQRVELCQRRAELFRDLVASAKGFVEGVGGRGVSPLQPQRERYRHHRAGDSGE